MTFAENDASRADILIIGNGALGLFLADELAGRGTGKTIKVVGPSAREAGASQAAGAMLGCFGEVTSETLRTEAGKKRFEIGVEAHGYWDRTIVKLNEALRSDKSIKVTDDSYIVLNSIGGELDTDNFNAIVDALNAYNQPWTDVDAKEIVGFNPRTDCRAFRAIHVPNEGAVDARLVLKALEIRLEAAGIPVIDQTVRKIRSDSNRVTGVELSDGRVIEADIVVVAAGARSEDLVASASDHLRILPTFPGLGLGMIAKRSRGTPFKSVVRTPNRGFACGLHLVPYGDGREYLGSTNRIVHKVMSIAWLEDLRYLAQYAMQQLDEEIAHHHVEQWLRGNRPVTFDGFPLIGWLPMSGLYLMTGTYRDGLHGAPMLADRVTNELLGKPRVLDPIFEPTRKPISTRTIEHSVNEFIQHSVATWYETGADSSQMPTKSLETYYRDKANKLYDDLGIDFGLSPDVLLYASGNNIGTDSNIGAERVKSYLKSIY
jgi:glycine oxidase